MKLVSRAVLALIVLGTVSALAQPDPSAGAGSGAPLSPKVSPPTSMGELNVRMQILSTQMDGDYRTALHARDTAKRQKDVIKVTCVNDRLVEMKAQMNLGDNAKNDLAHQGDSTGAVSEQSKSSFSQLASTAERVRVLREQAEACIGGPELAKQESGVLVESPEIPDEPGGIDPYGLPPGGIVEPPGYASAFD